MIEIAREEQTAAIYNKEDGVTARQRVWDDEGMSNTDSRQDIPVR